MDYARLLAVINARLFLVLATVMLAVLAAGATGLVMPVKYQARAVLMIKPDDNMTGGAPGMDYNSLMMYRQLARTYSELATSQPVLRELADHLNHHPGLGELEHMVKVRKVKDLELLEIVVTDTTPRRAAHIANSFADILQQQERENWRMNNLQMITPALPPGNPAGPNIILAMLVAGMAGLFAAVLIVLIADYPVSKR
ncbi:MAG: Wzz/FepE/Etk N-terminal domain-containing protein [Firmicutes bacterium]|nr:Wzz/FepE/Etk N-terminal domain-containing protein [Bacillota bacterium]